MDNYTQYIERLSADRVRDLEYRMDKIREALQNGKVRSIEFHKDGSGAIFYYNDPMGDHGLPCDVASSLPMVCTIKVISGFRFKQHELKICM